MSKLFMYGSELQELEQLMILVQVFYQEEAGDCITENKK